MFWVKHVHWVHHSGKADLYSVCVSVCVGVCVCAAAMCPRQLGVVPPAASVPTRQPTASNHMSAIWEAELLSAGPLTCVSL